MLGPEMQGHGDALASMATGNTEGHRAAACLLLSKQHRKRNPPHLKWEEELSFLFLRCYQELWKVHFKNILKVPLTTSLPPMVWQISKY